MWARPEVAPLPLTFAVEPVEPPRLFKPEGPAEGCASGLCAVEPATEALLDPFAVWSAAVEAVKLKSARQGASLAFGRLALLTEQLAVLVFPLAAGFHRVTVVGTAKSSIERLLTEHFGRPFRLRIEEKTDGILLSPFSPAERDATHKAAHEKTTEDAVRNHESVISTLRILGGEIEDIRMLQPTPLEDDDARN